MYSETGVFSFLEVKMKKIERLRQEALKSCKSRGHRMKPFSRRCRYWWDSECKVCGMGVFVSDNPAPNDIEISGEAVALNCEGKNEAV